MAEKIHLIYLYDCCPRIARAYNFTLSKQTVFSLVAQYTVKYFTKCGIIITFNSGRKKVWFFLNIPKQK